MEASKSIPQGLKPTSILRVYGTAKAVPFQNINDQLRGGHDQASILT
jgi:hypothetical protein